MFQDYRAGRLLTGQLKAKCIELLQRFVGDFQEVKTPILSIFVCFSSRFLQRKAKVTDDDIKAFMDPNRKIESTMGKYIATPSAP